MKRKKNIFIVFLLIAVIFMGIGYAFLSSTLKIESTTKSSGKWDVVIDKITVKNKSTDAVSKNIQITEDKLSANFAIDLYNDGDFIEYNVSVKNNGTIPARLEDASINVEKFNDYIETSNTANVGSVIYPGQTTDFDIKVAVNTNGQTIVEDGQGIYNLTLRYVQNSS